MELKSLKRLLKEYPYMTEKIQGIKKEIEGYKEQAAALREVDSIILDGMPKAGVLSDPTARKAQKIVDDFDKRVEMLLDEIELIINEQQRFTDMLRRLSHDEYAVIEARYFKGLSWDFVPGEVKMSRSICFDVHNEVLFRMLQN